MPEVCFLPYSLIPLSSDEPLWEWDIVTNTFFLTQGAVRQLKLTGRPRSMEDFYKLIPPDAVAELTATREGLISGKSGSLAQSGYICNGLWVQEHALVLTRNSEGRATRIMGQIAISPVARHIGFKSGHELLGEVGLWLYDAKNCLLWRDRICEEILGRREASYPISSGTGLFEVSPPDREALKRHFELFCSGSFLGDTITDMVRLRLPDGEYISSLVRATAIERDENGRAVLISGMLAPGERQLAQLQALTTEDPLFQALSSMGDGHWNWDTHQDTIYFGPRYLAMLGYAPEDDNFVARNWRDYVHPDDLAKVEQARQLVISSAEHGDTYESTYRMKRADGDWAWIFDRGCVTWRDEDGRAGHLIGSITNITTAQAERDKLEELVRHDSLTGLRSRAFCNLEIEHIEQNGIRPVSVISVDITGLKMVNDYLGHARGDELLTKAASLMRKSLRRSDCIGRVGGDEFLILLPGCDRDKGEKVLEKLKSNFEEYNGQNPELPVFAAAGLACADNMEKSVTATMAEADEEMYRDKKMERHETHRRLKELIKEETGKIVGEDDRLAD